MTATFIADIGGTNIRLAQYVDGQLICIEKFLCADYPSIADAIAAYYRLHPQQKFESACLAIACPVEGDWVKMTNHSWAFSQQALREQLGLQQLWVINDFTSVAHSLALLGKEQKCQIGPGQAREQANIAVFGPGTGLGVKHLTHTPRGWQALDGEGGHVDFAPVDSTDLVLWQYLVRHQGRASAEELMSGPGLVNIYRALAEYREQPALLSDPAAITKAALAGQCTLCEATLAQFCRVLGSFAGNLALNLGAFGGVYIGGGIVPRFIDYLQRSDFRQRFEQKGRFTDYVTSIPTFVITEPDHGLLGAAAYMQQQLTYQ